MVGLEKMSLNGTLKPSSAYSLETNDMMFKEFAPISNMLALMPISSIFRMSSQMAAIFLPTHVLEAHIPVKRPRFDLALEGPSSRLFRLVSAAAHQASANRTAPYIPEAPSPKRFDVFLCDVSFGNDVCAKNLIVALICFGGNRRFFYIAVP